MARKKTDVRIRLDRQEKKILHLTKELEKAQEEYEELIKERDELDKEELFQAFRNSKRTYEEVMDFIKGKADI